MDFSFLFFLLKALVIASGRVQESQEKEKLCVTEKTISEWSFKGSSDILPSALYHPPLSSPPLKMAIGV